METDADLQRLIDAHPLLFRGRAPDVPSYLSKGWYSLVDTLCTNIEAALGPEGCNQFEVRQIKEKYSTLCFYYRLGDREDLHVDVQSSSGVQRFVGRLSKPETINKAAARIRELVGAACQASGTICETCGASGQLRNLGGWVTTLCDQHLAEAVAKRSSGSA